MSDVVPPEREENAVYQPKDAVSASIRATLITGGAGALISAVQNTLKKQNVSAWGVFTRTGGTIAVLGMTYWCSLCF